MRPTLGAPGISRAVRDDWASRSSWRYQEEMSCADVATGIDDSGRLVVRDDATGAERAWLVGDVTHVRKVG